MDTKIVGEVNIMVKPENTWQEEMSAMKISGTRSANKMRGPVVRILAPRDTVSKRSIPLSSVLIDPDWKADSRLEMVEHARDFITLANKLDCLDPSLPTALAAVVGGGKIIDLFEFFQLYGRFEEKHGTTGKRTADVMRKLIGNESKYMKKCTERGKLTDHPLPYAVRNMIAHQANNPNKWDGNDLRISIDFLRSWTKP